MKLNQYFFSAIFWVLLFCISSCGDEVTTPRPQGYLRIQLPSKEYDTVQTNEYSFLKNKSALFRKVVNPEVQDGNYSELFYKSLKATYYFSYFEPDTNLSKLIDDCHALAYNHTGKADDIVPVKVDYPNNNVHGLIYEFKGNAATPIQFYVTDSTNHFLRGSLYFYAKPNFDSIQPVLEFVRKDLDRVLSSLRWKKS
jgi:gliding motility-associated lipoprotein GldD